MKKFIIIFTFIAIALSVISCQPQENQDVISEQQNFVEPYHPSHHAQEIVLESLERYNYFPAPTDMVAENVSVVYNHKKVYTEPIVIIYTYENGDSYTYTIPKDFGLWKNEYGHFKVIIDNETTVWLQGQTKNGRFHEFVFYGNPKLNRIKIKPNSYIERPDGVIGYCE